MLFLDPDAVDRVLIRAHTELQRLNEGLPIGAQVAELLGPILGAVRMAGLSIARTGVVDGDCCIDRSIQQSPSHNNERRERACVLQTVLHLGHGPDDHVPTR